MKYLGSLESTQEATPRATLTHLSCSPNFPHASYLDERTLTYEPIVNESGTYRRLITSLNTDCLTVKLCLFPIIAFHLVRTHAIMWILMGVILRLKRSQWAKRLYLLQLKDCHYHNNYKGRKVVSHIYVRTPLRVGFDGDFVTYHAGHLQTQFTYLHAALWNYVNYLTIFPLFFGGRGGVEMNYVMRSRLISTIVMWT